MRERERERELNSNYSQRTAIFTERERERGGDGEISKWSGVECSICTSSSLMQRIHSDNEFDVSEKS